ncbi:hypothetical protein BGZ73_008220 [Actinomortierella ambigua]|nr:hypothetical protein BGZ73_008220 [Actinomortierella ambigua]
MKFTTVVVAVLAIISVAQSAVIPTEVEAAAPAKNCGCQRWCRPKGTLLLCCEFKPCSGA